MRLRVSFPDRVWRNVPLEFLDIRAHNVIVNHTAHNVNHT
jgi:hypothetical protein